MANPLLVFLELPMEQSDFRLRLNQIVSNLSHKWLPTIGRVQHDFAQVNLTRTQNRNRKKGAKRTKREGTPDTPGGASQGRNDPEPNPPGKASPTRAEPGKGAK